MDLIKKGLDVILSYCEDVLDPRFFQSSSQGLKPVYREITNEEIAIDEEEAINKKVVLWTKDLCDLPPIYHKEIYAYMIDGIISLDIRNRGSYKHKIIGYQL